MCVGNSNTRIRSVHYVQSDPCCVTRQKCFGSAAASRNNIHGHVHCTCRHLVRKGTALYIVQCPPLLDQVESINLIVQLHCIVLVDDDSMKHVAPKPKSVSCINMLNVSTCNPLPMYLVVEAVAIEVQRPLKVVQ